MLSDYVRRERPDEKDEDVVERSAVGIRLNGYAIGEMPRLSAATSVELTALSVTAPSAFLKALRADMDELTGGIPMSAHSASIAASFAAGSLLPTMPDYVLCDIGGETTELLLVLEHIPAARATFALGSNLFPRTLQAHAGLGAAEISSAMRLAKEKKSPMREKLGGTFVSAEREYGKAFSQALRQLSQAGGNAPVIYLLCEEGLQHWLSRAVEGSGLVPPPEIRAVDAEMFGAYLLRTPSAEDVPLSLYALFADARFDERRAFNFKLT